ncbi:protocadherin gamma-C3-like isoform X13 [Cygnus olor]|uniref:protocadherin gamma-C3-like isoform X13 n=1 Tax=Cygnus olor TaxID=8869 RepID=UPI001ADDE7F5|nr:protocadherin gamma-C3-like isoform X13 [Cygnus olor]
MNSNTAVVCVRLQALNVGKPPCREVQQPEMQPENRPVLGQVPRSARCRDPRGCCSRRWGGCPRCQHDAGREFAASGGIEHRGSKPRGGEEGGREGGSVRPRVLRFVGEDPLLGQWWRWGAGRGRGCREPQQLPAGGAAARERCRFVGDAALLAHGGAPSRRCGTLGKGWTLGRTGSRKQAQPNTDWRFSQTQRPGTSGSQNGEEGGAWPNNQFDTEMLQAMILASANEAADGNSTLGGGTGTMGLSARYGPQFTLQHVPDYRQNVYIPGSTATLTNAAGKRDAKGAGSSGGNKKKSGKKEKEKK